MNLWNKLVAVFRRRKAPAMTLEQAQHATNVEMRQRLEKLRVPDDAWYRDRDELRQRFNGPARERQRREAIAEMQRSRGMVPPITVNGRSLPPKPAAPTPAPTMNPTGYEYESRPRVMTYDDETAAAAGAIGAAIGSYLSHNDDSCKRDTSPPVSSGGGGDFGGGGAEASWGDSDTSSASSSTDSGTTTND